jgi:hypothetical protein
MGLLQVSWVVLRIDFKETDRHTKIKHNWKEQLRQFLNSIREMR